jgi:hypothetical protein
MNSAIIKELDHIIQIHEMAIKTATRLKKKIEGGVSTPPKKKETKIDQGRLKAIAKRRENFIKSKVA